MKNIITVVLTLLISSFASAGESPKKLTLLQIQTSWADANYQLEGKPKIAAFEQLLLELDQVLIKQPGNYQLRVWRAVTQSTLAKAKGGLGALPLVKAAKKDLELVIKRGDPLLLAAAYTNLGALYHNVPSWPVGFGSQKKAKKMLKASLEIDPEGIDSNYFYGVFLADNSKLELARKHLKIAQKAAPRLGRASADAGRQNEITQLLRQLLSED